MSGRVLLYVAHRIMTVCSRQASISDLHIERATASTVTYCARS
jgi:hypothetical protein